MDTLSWARLGANVTGVDFSDEAIRLAQKLSQQTGLPGRFICCDLYDLPQHLTETFDIVYTSYGVLSWLPDLPNWAKLAARYLKPGGIFYIAEFHPLSMMLDETAEQPVLRYPYFKEGPAEFAVQGSYADPTAECAVKTEYDWFYTLEGVITSLLAAGLKLEFVHEFPYTVYPQLPYLVRGEDGYWHMITFSPRPGRRSSNWPASGRRLPTCRPIRVLPRISCRCIPTWTSTSTRPTARRSWPGSSCAGI